MSENGVDEEPMPALDELISIPRAARLLGADPSRLARRAQAGRFPATKVGGNWITTLNQIIEAERSGTVQGKRGPRQKPLPKRIQDMVDGTSETETIPDA